MLLYPFFMFLLFSLCSCSNTDKDNGINNNDGKTNITPNTDNNNQLNSTNNITPTETLPKEEDSVSIGTRDNPLLSTPQSSMMVLVVPMVLVAPCMIRIR